MERTALNEPAVTDAPDVCVFGMQAVQPEHVADLWPEAEPLLRVACERRGLYATSHLLCDLGARVAQLWRVDGAWVVTRIAPFPKARVAIVDLVGGVIAPQRVPEMLEAFRLWAAIYRADRLVVLDGVSGAQAPPGWGVDAVWTQRVGRAVQVPNSIN